MEISVGESYYIKNVNGNYIPHMVLSINKRDNKCLVSDNPVLSTGKYDSIKEISITELIYLVHRCQK